MAYRTVAEIKQYAAQMLSEDETDNVLAGSTAEGTHDLLDRWLITSFERIYTWMSWERFEGQKDFTWPAGTSTTPAALYLPEYVTKILSTDPHVILMDAWQMDGYSYSTTRNVSRDILVQHGRYGVENDMPSSTTITATSSAGASDENLQCVIEGLVSDRRTTETLTLNSSGTATSTNSWDSGREGVRRIYIIPTSVPTAGGGVVTFTAGSTTMERLDASLERQHDHIRTELYNNLSGTTTLSVRYYERPFRPSASTDIVPVDDEFSDLIELGIQKQLHLFKKDFGNAAATEQQWQMRMKEYMAWNNRKPGQKRQLNVQRQWGRRIWSNTSR